MPNESEIAERFGVGVERWRRMAGELKMVGLLSLSSRGPEQDAGPAPEFPARRDSQPDYVCSQKQLRTLLESAMKTLPERYQKVVFLYYSNEMTMKEIGRVLGVNESRVSQIHKTALERMASALHSAGIHSAGAF
jgi:RNA polymerase sigma factor for flagellar operon FliA